MNPDSPIDPRSALEASLTALLLGELPHDQAAALHQKLAQDAELAALYERLKHTIALVRETIATPAAQATTSLLPLRLEEQRRQKLLQHFKTVAPKEFAAPPRRSMRWLLPVGIAAAFVLILGGLALPTLRSYKESAQSLALFEHGPSVAMRSPAPAEPLADTAEKHFRSAQDGRTEQLALGTENRRRSALVSASFGESPKPAQSAGAAIVLPKAGQPDVADTTATVLYSSQPEPAAAANVRGYYDDSSGRSGGVGGAATFGGFAANTRGRAAGGAEGQPTKGAVFDDFYTHPEALGVKESAAPASGREESEAFRRRYGLSSAASSASSPASPPPQPPARPATLVASPVTRSLAEEQLGVTSGKDLSSVSALLSESSAPADRVEVAKGSLQTLTVTALSHGFPSDGVEVAKAPLQQHIADTAAGDLFAGVPVHAAGLPPAEVAKTEEVLQRADVAWSDATKKTLDAPVVEARLNAAADGKATKGVQKGFSLLGPAEAEKPASPTVSLGFATIQNEPAPEFKGTPKDVALKPAEPLAQAAPAPPVEAPAFGVGEGTLVTPSASARDRTRSVTVGNDPEFIGMLGQTKEKFAQADAGRAGRAAAPVATSDLSVVNGVAQSLNYQWDFDAGKARGLANADGEKPPVLGDLPAVGRFYRLADGAGPGGAPVPPGVAYTPAPDQAQEGITPNYSVTVERLAERGVPADSERDHAWYAKSASKEGAPLAFSGGRPQNELSAGALRLKVEEKVKSVELAKKLDSVASGIENVQESIPIAYARPETLNELTTVEKLRDLGRQHAESEGKSPYSVNVVGYYNVPGPVTNYVVIAPTKTTPTPRFDIALPAAKGELSQAQRDSNGATKKIPQLIAANREMQRLERRPQAPKTEPADVAPPKPAAPAPVPQPEVTTSDNAFSTFSLNVSDVSFKLAAASLEKGVMPEPATVRSEEFINAFDYRDSEPPPGVPVAFAWERAQYPFAQNRDLLRFSIKTAALGRQPGRPLNLVLLLDNSGSMERADRVRIIREALRVLAGQLQPQDKLSVVAFARTPRLFADGAPGTDAEAVALALTELTPQGGTNLEDAMDLAYQTARRHYLANGINRVVVLTDGAANLGNVEPDGLKQKVEANRKQGIALDCFGIGWEGYNDDLLEVLSRNGDGRYGFINTPEEAATEFAGQLAGALKVAASDVKVQVEFNPARVTAYRQIGYAKHQLTKEQFRDNTVDAAEIGAAESGNALYVVEVNPRGSGALATVRVRYKVPGTSDYREQEWPVPYTGNAEPLEQASPALRLAATASAFSEWLVSSPYAAEVTPDRLLGYLTGVPEIYGADARPKKLEWMLRQAKSIAGK